MSEDNRAFLRLLIETETALTALLDLLGRQLQQGLQRRSPEQIQAIVYNLFDEFSRAYEELVTNAAAETAGIQADVNAAQLLPLLAAAGATGERRRQSRRFAGYREEIRRRFPVQPHPEDEKTFVDRVKTVRDGFRSTVYQMIRQGVNDGTDPRKLAFQIRDYVIATPTSRSGERFREAARLRDRASTYVARGAPSGSVQFNAIRIVRTEMATIYRNSVMDFYEGRPYLEGYDWLLSNRHPGPDRCDGFAAGSPYDARAAVPSTHPNCLCRLVARVMSQREILQLIRSGALD